MDLDPALLSVLQEFSELDDFILERGADTQGHGVAQQHSPQDVYSFPSSGFQGGEHRSASESSLEFQPLAGPGPGSLQAQAGLQCQRSSEGGKGGKRGRGSAATACNQKDVAALQQLYDEKLTALEKLQQENTYLRKRSRILQLIVNCRDDQVQRLQLLKSGQIPDPFVPLGSTVEIIKRGDPMSLMPKWKALCSELGTYLMEDPSLNNTKLVQMVNMLSESCKYVFLVNPDLMVLTSKHVNSEGADENWHAPEGWWHQVVAQMRETFSPQQLEDTCLLHEMYCTWHNRVLEERQKLAANLSSLSSAPRYGKALFDAATSTAGCNSHMAEGQLVQKLQHNLIKERCLIVLITEVWYMHVLNALQYAQFMVHSYPHIPDDVALMAATAALKTRGSVNGSSPSSGSGSAPR